MTYTDIQTDKFPAVSFVQFTWGSFRVTPTRVQTTLIFSPPPNEVSKTPQLHTRVSSKHALPPPPLCTL